MTNKPSEADVELALCILALSITEFLNDRIIYQLSEYTEDIAIKIANHVAKQTERLEQEKRELVEALFRIRDIDLADCEKYVQKTDSIACETLAEIDKQAQGVK